MDGRIEKEKESRPLIKRLDQAPPEHSVTSVNMSAYKFTLLCKQYEVGFLLFKTNIFSGTLVNIHS